MGDKQDTPVVEETTAEAGGQNGNEEQVVDNKEETNASRESGEGSQGNGKQPESTAGATAGDSAGDADLAARAEQLEQQLSEAKDQALRQQAEMQNIRRRAERDVEQAHKFGLEKLVNSLLPVLDNLDRAIGSVHVEDRENNDAVKSMLEGVELTRKSAVDALQLFSVEVLDPLGEPFDPQFHEAMTAVASPTAEPNSVLDVLQKGYTLNGRLIRAAMVVVAKAAD